MPWVDGVPEVIDGSGGGLFEESLELEKAISMGLKSGLYRPGSATLPRDFDGRAHGDWVCGRVIPTALGPWMDMIVSGWSISQAWQPASMMAS